MELEKNVEKYGLLFISAVTVLLLTIIELILEPWNIVNMAFVYLLVLKGLPVLWREASETIFNEKAERMWFRCMVIIVFFMIVLQLAFHVSVIPIIVRTFSLAGTMFITFRVYTINTSSTESTIWGRVIEGTLLILCLYEIFFNNHYSQYFYLATILLATIYFQWKKIFQ